MYITFTDCFNFGVRGGGSFISLISLPPLREAGSFVELGGGGVGGEMWSGGGEGGGGVSWPWSIYTPADMPIHYL